MRGQTNSHIILTAVSDCKVLSGKTVQQFYELEIKIVSLTLSRWQLTVQLTVQLAMSSAADLDAWQRQSHEGFLSKQSPKAGGGWQRRWFVLDGPAATLSYFKEKDARTLFEELDADGSGFLDSGEIEELCKQMGRKLGKKELAKAMTEIDTDGNDEVSFSEFEAWWALNGGRAADKRKPAGVIDLHEITDIRLVAKKIQLLSGERSYWLAADTKDEAVAWRASLCGGTPVRKPFAVCHGHPPMLSSADLLSTPGYVCADTGTFQQ